MRRRHVVLVVFFLGLAAPAQAGIYHPAEPTTRLTTLREFTDRLDTLRSMASAPTEPNIPPHPERTRYLEQIANLEYLQSRGLLTIQNRVNLSAYYLRLNQIAKAKDVLEAVPPEQRDFMVLANLATAYHLSDMLDRAILTQQQALDAWPEFWAGLTTSELLWFRRAEQYFLALLKARKQEAPRPPGQPPQDVDGLFPGLKFAGPKGDFEIGEISVFQWDKLPWERDQILSQLILWLPFDDRLYWLMAEVLNAQGNALLAGDMMDELVYRRQFNVPLLRRHRQILMDDEVRKALEVLKTDQAGLAVALSLWFVAPRGAGLAPGVAGAYPEAGWVVALSNRSPAPPTPPPVDTPKKSGYLPDLGAVMIGLAVGVVVGVLLTLQVRALRKPAS